MLFLVDGAIWLALYFVVAFIVAMLFVMMSSSSHERTKKSEKTLEYYSPPSEIFVDRVKEAEYEGCRKRGTNVVNEKTNQPSTRLQCLDLSTCHFISIASTGATNTARPSSKPLSPTMSLFSRTKLKV